MGLFSSIESGVSDLWGGLTGQTASDAAGKAANLQAQAQQDALDYMKQSEALPMQYRDQSMGMLAGLYGLGGTGGTGGGNRWASKNAPVMGSDEALQSLMNTPIYQAIMSGQADAEEAILRNAGATGGLRSIGTNIALADNTTDLRNQALMSSMQGLQGFAGMPSNANAIAQQMAGIGQTQAQGITAGAQAEQAGMGNLINLGLGIGSIAAMPSLVPALGAATTQTPPPTSIGGGLSYSDIRLKDNVKEIGEVNGHKWYSWDWNDKASKLGLSGSSEGVMAHEVAEYMPDAIDTEQDYLTVNYEMLGVTH